MRIVRHIALRLPVLVAALLPATTFGQAAVRYELSFPNHVHHEAVVEIVFPDLVPSVLEVRMSRSSPGRYRLHDFARNVYSFEAFDGDGRRLEASKSDPYGWRISGHDGSVRVRYTVFGDLMSGTYSAIDETHAHLNAPSVLAWARGLEDRPVEVRLVPPEDGWRVATQLEATSEPLVFRAPDLAYLLDSPIELSDHEVREWRVGQGEQAQQFRLAVHHEGRSEDVDRWVELTKKVVAESAAVFGELPVFDFGSYVFLLDRLPWSAGDAMEHRNSTILSSPPSRRGELDGFLATLSHEFFHVWNVERLRPASLEPFDFDGVTFSEDLWFSEGFTNYYDGLLLVRAGIWDQDDWEEDLSVSIDRIVNSPAPGMSSALEMSRMAAFRDRGQWVDPQNSGNTYLHYYFHGEAIALALDLELRAGFDVDLDDYLRELWVRFGRRELAFTTSDLKGTLAEISSGPFAESFFARFVEGHEVADYERLLQPAGFEVRSRRPGAAWLGSASLVFGDEGARVSSMTTMGSPLYEAGVDRGDVLVSLGGRRLRSRKSLEKALARRPGEVVALVVLKRDGRRELEIRVGADPELEVVGLEKTGRPLTEEKRRFREAWLAPRSVD